MVLATAACSHSKGSASSSSSTTALTGPQPTPKSTPTAAVDALLSAEQHNDHAASYLVLTPASRQGDFRNSDRWARRRNELPPITAYTIERTDKDTVVALVQHKPGLDPFTGLALARERQRWKTAKAAGGPARAGGRQGGKRARAAGGSGSLVDGEPTFEPIYPAEDAAKPAAVSW